MRWTAFLFLFVTMAGCTTQSSGQRCQQNADCNTDTDTCRNENSPERECNGTACICCPVDPTAASAITACIPRVGRTDSGVTEAGTSNDTGGSNDTGSRNDTGSSNDTGAVVDAGTDAGAVTDLGASVDTGAAVDAGTPCTASTDCMLGQFCGGATCGGAGHCATRPTSCGAVLNLVCGCDGRTYSNPCEAASAGVRVSAPDACPAVDSGTPADTGATPDAGAATDVPAAADAPAAD